LSRRLIPASRDGYRRLAVEDAPVIQGYWSTEKFSLEHFNLTTFHVNRPLFIVPEVILALYIIVAILVYANRPANFLTRLPTSIAAIISFAAAGTVVREFKVTAHLSTEERAAFLEKEKHVFGYGTCLSGDGAVHVGIERTPFVSRVREEEVEVQTFELPARRFGRLGKVRGKYRVIGQEGGVPLERLK
jgi:hypothetical protein